jgi:hypothetical protein
MKLLTLTFVFLAGIATDRLVILEPIQAQSTGYSERQTLSIGSASVSVGMSRAELERTVAGAGYRMGRGDVSPIYTLNGGVFHSLASVSFRNNVVEEVSRGWGGGQQGAAIEELFHSLWGALTTNLPESKEFTSASVRVYRLVEPSQEFETVELGLTPHRSVTIQHGSVDPTQIPGVTGPTGRVSSVWIEERVR